MSKPVLFAIGALLILLLVGVNMVGKNSNAVESHDDEDEKPAATATENKPAAPAKPAVAFLTDKAITTKTGLKYEDVQVGTGPEAKPGQSVSVHYTGTLVDGTKFDSSRDKGEPFSFSLGAGQVIPGWDEGVAGMKVGGKRKLVVPPDLGYGSQGAGGGAIPPNATLNFDVELLKVGG